MLGSLSETLRPFYFYFPLFLTYDYFDCDAMGLRYLFAEETVYREKLLCESAAAIVRTDIAVNRVGDSRLYCYCVAEILDDDFCVCSLASSFFFCLRSDKK